MSVSALDSRTNTELCSLSVLWEESRESNVQSRDPGGRCLGLVVAVRWDDCHLDAGAGETLKGYPGAGFISVIPGRRVAADPESILRSAAGYGFRIRGLRAGGPE